MKVSGFKLLCVFLVAFLLLATLAEGKKSKKAKGKPGKGEPWRHNATREGKVKSEAEKKNVIAADDPSQKDNSTRCHSDHDRHHSVQRRSHKVHIHVHDDVKSHHGSPHHSPHHGFHGHRGHFSHGHGRSLRGRSRGHSRHDHSRRRSSGRHSGHRSGKRSRHYSGKRHGSRGSHDHSHRRSGHMCPHDRSHKKSAYHKHGHDGTHKSFHRSRHDHDRSHGGRSHDHRRGHGSAHGSTHVHIRVSVEEKRKSRRHDKSPSKYEFVYTRCQLKANNPDDDVSGTILLRQKPWSRHLEVKVNVAGIDRPQDLSADASTKHGLHVHEFGDFSERCASFGGHFNPDGVEHGGAHNETRHVGDWGNIEVDAQGEAHVYLNITDAALFGPRSILGRGIVLHAGEDDLGQGGDEGSLATGNAGARVACCIIARTKSLADEDW